MNVKEREIQIDIFLETIKDIALDIHDDNEAVSTMQLINLAISKLDAVSKEVAKEVL